MALHHYPLITFTGRALVLGDGIKVGKEARRMPAVKTLHQDSDNSGKAPYIRGHHFGFVGLLVGSLGKAFCLPLRAQLHEGIEGLRSDLGWNSQPATVVTRMGCDRAIPKILIGRESDILSDKSNSYELLGKDIKIAG